MKQNTFSAALTEIDDRYLMEAAALTEQRTMRKTKKWAVVPIAAALLAMAMFVVNAAAPVDLGFYLAAAFGDSYEMLDEMTSMPEPIAYRSSGDEIKLEMKGLVGDRQVVDVFVDVTVSAECGIPGENYRPIMDLSDTGFPWETNLAAYGTSARVLSTTQNDDGSTTYACMLSLHSEDGVMASKYNVSCSGIAGWDTESGDYETLVEGEWNMAFALNYSDLTEVRTPDITGEIQGTHWSMMSLDRTADDMASAVITVDEVRISPLSVGMYFSADLQYKAFFSDYMIEDIYLTMEDGTVITRRDYIVGTDGMLIRLHEEDQTWEEITRDDLDDIYVELAGGGGGYNLREGELYHGHHIFTFSAPLPVEEIVSITIGGLEIPMK